MNLYHLIIFLSAFSIAFSLVSLFYANRAKRISRQATKRMEKLRRTTSNTKSP